MTRKNTALYPKDGLRRVVMRSSTWSKKTGTGGDTSPPFPSAQEFTPGGVGVDELPDRAVAHDQDDERVIDDFRQLVRNRLGHLGTAVLDARLAGEETKNLVGRQDLGNPGRWVLKNVVSQIKALASEFAQRLGDPAFVRDILRAMERETTTVQKRLNTAAARKDHRGQWIAGRADLGEDTTAKRADTSSQY